MFESPDYSGKTAVVTGASSGIGQALAKMLAQSGAKVFAVARREDRLKALSTEFPNIVPVMQDITQPLDNLAAAIEGQSIDVLFNNAGGALGREPIQEYNPQKWQGMIDMNVSGLIAVTQLILPRMIAAGTGDVMNVGSISAYQVYGGGSVYCATKFAVRALTEAWQQDVIGTGVRIMGIHPGLVDTEFSKVRFDGNQNKADAVYENMTPLSAEDVAESALWMLSRPRHVNLSSVMILPTDQASTFHVHRRTS